MDERYGIPFERAFQKELKDQFYFTDADPDSGSRLFFDNSGGSLRLKAAVEAKAALERFPDCPERDHPRGQALKSVVREGTREILETVFGAKNGALMPALTASQCMFRIVDTIMDGTEGTNAVVSVLEHPSAYDAVASACQKYRREMRVIPANPETGRIQPEAAAALVDSGTCLVSVMSASNISGSVMDMEAIVRAVRAVNTNACVVSDAVQHAPHMAIEAERIGLDAVNFAPYKFFGVRGCGFAYMSERVAAMPHAKLLAKPAEVFELGTPAPGNFAAMIAVIEYVRGIGRHFISGSAYEEYREGMRRIHLQERALLHRMLEGTPEIPGLRHIKGIEISADPASLENRDLIAGIRLRGMDVKALAEAFLRRGVVTAPRAADSLYSKRIVEALGASEGLVRVSPMHCHGEEDIDRFLTITAEIAAENA